MTDEYASTVLGRLHGWISTSIKASARDNIKLFEPTVAAIGTFSKFAERKLRQKLSVAPEFVEFDRSPTGATLASPIRMKTCNGRDQIARLIYYKGWSAFEHPLPSLLEAALGFAPDGLFFDVGANTGLYSLLVKALRPKHGVHAFEPFPPALDVLRSNIALNTFAADVVVVDAATSDETGSAELFIPTQEHGLVETSSSLSSTFKPYHSEVVPVKTISLDDYCRQADLGPVRIIKIDVEGAEDRVISGAAELMGRDNPIIFSEILPNSSAWSVIPTVLAETGYLRAAIHTQALIIQDDPRSDPIARNHVLFPRSLEPAICEMARVARVCYRTS